MKYLLILLFLLPPALASAATHSDAGQRICRAEVGPDRMAQQQCLREFQKTSYLVRRYLVHAKVFDNQNERVSRSFFEIFENPFVISARRVSEICLTGQVFNGNLFSGFMDFREVWECISDLDPEAASWDTI
ncbi:MAG: hypothetical protein L3J33_00440 [Rhodobacteraceae bacterium]|nr:hypothetical protein [Paracoccaceae bacterium]